MPHRYMKVVGFGIIQALVERERSSPGGKMPGKREGSLEARG